MCMWNGLGQQKREREMCAGTTHGGLKACPFLLNVAQNCGPISDQSVWQSKR